MPKRAAAATRFDAKKARTGKPKKHSKKEGQEPTAQRVIVVEPDRAYEERVLGIEDLQKLVGGPVAHISCDPVLICVNEDQANRPRNHLLSEFLHVFAQLHSPNPSNKRARVPLFGTGLICSASDEQPLTARQVTGNLQIAQSMLAHNGKKWASLDAASLGSPAVIQDGSSVS